jgi:aminomethyltransferase
MRRSPLHDKHAELGARFTDFGGWEMPLRYDSVIAEHKAVRSGAGVFDVTHLGRFDLTGAGAHAAVKYLLSNDIDRVSPGRCQYTLLLDARGGIQDDLIVWWWGKDHFRIMPNAANHEMVMSVFASRDGVKVEDLQKSTVLLAVQGPEAPRMLEEILGDTPRRFHTGAASFAGGTVEMAGTGYTGEAGAEVCAEPDIAATLLDALLESGAAPAGLGARDTLRLEAGLPLWGEDIDRTTTPLEAGLGFAVSFDHDFVGKEALMAMREVGAPRRLIGFVLEERGIPRHGYPVRTSGGSTGTVTSGNLSPMIERGIGLAYIAPPPAPDETIEVEIRGNWLPARQAKPPFHRQEEK